MKKSSSQLISRGAKTGAGGVIQGSRAGTGAAGAAGGTLLAAFANGMSDSNPLKQWCILAAPSISVFLGIASLWLLVKISNYFHDREFLSTKQKLSKILEEGINDPSTTPQHREQLKKDYEELRLIEVDRYMTRIMSIKTTTEADFQNR